ncbi:MAG: ADP-ribosylation factor-like protein, partial [Candidatus Heimdallarchaeota archaeon]
GVNLLLRGSTIHKILPGSTKKISFIKIVFFGLDQAGKTSLIQFIKKKEPLTVLKEFLPSTRPTVGVDYQKIEFQEIPIILQELGGQKSLRESHLQNLASYFKDCHIGVFVVDSTDILRFIEALNFFKRVNQKLDEINYNIPIKIAVHKADTGISDANEIINELIYSLSMELNISLIDLMNNVYVTSIKNMSSISSFFSSIIEEILPIRSYITNGLSTLISLYPLDYCCLIDPELSRIPLGWVSKLDNLDPRTLINHILEYTEQVISELDVKKPLKLKESRYTIKISNYIKELIYLPIFLENGKKEYYFVFSYSEDWESYVTADMPPLDSLVKRALDPQLELALLAIKSQERI